MQNLRDREVTALSKLLSLQNSAADSHEEFVDYWKVLVYDEDCRDIISPLMNVGALRQKGVTLHLLLHSEREQIQDAPAVYFVRPTSNSLKRIVADCAKKLYRTFYIHFVTRIDRPLLEQFATDLIAANATSAISKIYDEYLDFIALEPTMFTLNIKDSFVGYNAPSLTETHIKQYMDRVTMGLLSAIRVMGTLPIIRAAPGGAAEMLARSVFQALSENLTARGPAYSLFADCLVSTSGSTDYASSGHHGSDGSSSGGSTTSSRPLLLIFDRSCDLTPPVMHTSSYQALIDDLLDHRLNRVTVDVSTAKGADSNAATAAPSATKRKTYDVNTQIDAFFAHYASATFPDAVEANEKELRQVSQQETDIRKRSTAAAQLAADMGNNVDENSGGHSRGGAAEGDSLGRDIESLPEILARKANLEAHTNILQAIMKKIASREVPTYFEVESGIVNHTRGPRIDDKGAVIDLLLDTTKGNVADKARLLLLATVALATNPGGNDGTFKPTNVLLSAISSSNGSPTKVSIDNEYEDAFVTGCKGIQGSATTSPGAATAPAAGAGDANAPVGHTDAAVEKVLLAVHFVRKQLSLSSPLGQLRGGAAGADSGDAFTSLFSTASSHATSLLAKATNFFSKFSPMFVTKVVESLAEGRSSNENSTYCYFDAKAKLTGGSGTTATQRDREMRYPEVIVFVMGGGCYNEFNNLQELIKQKLSASGAGNSSTPVLNNSAGITGQHTYCPRSIMYGCTELTSGSNFVKQLEALGSGGGGSAGGGSGNAGK